MAVLILLDETIGCQILKNRMHDERKVYMAERAILFIAASEKKNWTPFNTESTSSAIKWPLLQIDYHYATRLSTSSEFISQLIQYAPTIVKGLTPEQLENPLVCEAISRHCPDTSILPSKPFTDPLTALRINRSNPRTVFKMVKEGIPVHRQILDQLIEKGYRALISMEGLTHGDITRACYNNPHIAKIFINTFSDAVLLSLLSKYPHLTCDIDEKRLTTSFLEKLLPVNPVFVAKINPLLLSFAVRYDGNAIEEAPEAFLENFQNVRLAFSKGLGKPYRNVLEEVVDGDSEKYVPDHVGRFASSPYVTGEASKALLTLSGNLVAGTIAEPQRHKEQETESPDLSTFMIRLVQMHHKAILRVEKEEDTPLVATFLELYPDKVFDLPLVWFQKERMNSLILSVPQLCLFHSPLRESSPRYRAYKDLSEFINNKTLIMNIIDKHGPLIGTNSEKYCMVHGSGRSKFSLLECLSDDLRSDMDIVKACITKEPSTFESSHKSLHSKRELISMCVERGYIPYRYSVEKDASSFIKAISSGAISYSDLTDDIKHNVEIIRGVIKTEPSIYAKLSPSMASDPSILLALLQNQGNRTVTPINNMAREKIAGLTQLDGMIAHHHRVLWLLPTRFLHSPDFLRRCLSLNERTAPFMNTCLDYLGGSPQVLSELSKDYMDYCMTVGDRDTFSMMTRKDLKQREPALPAIFHDARDWMDLSDEQHTRILVSKLGPLIHTLPSDYVSRDLVKLAIMNSPFIISSVLPLIGQDMDFIRDTLAEWYIENAHRTY